jgi:hypothetical protein
MTVLNIDPIAFTQKDEEQINEVSAYAHKFDEIYKDLSELDFVDLMEREDRLTQFKRLETAKIAQVLRAAQEIRLQLFLAEDIQKETLGKARVSIVKNSDYFVDDIKTLKSKLLHTLYIHNFSVISDENDEICIRYGTIFNENSLFVDYFIKKTLLLQTKVISNEDKLMWGI